MRNFVTIIEEGHRLTDDLITSVLQKLADEHKAQYSIDSYYAQMDLDDDEIEDELAGEIYNAEAQISRHITNGTITLYREIIAPKDWDHRMETRHHAFWAYSADNAHAHWGEGDGIRWLITAQAAEQDIDWVNTLAMNANPMLSDEAEVRLNTGTQPRIINASPRSTGFRNNHF